MNITHIPCLNLVLGPGTGAAATSAGIGQNMAVTLD